jgi:hypothetical protein
VDGSARENGERRINGPKDSKDPKAKTMLRRQLKSSWMEWPWEMSNFFFSSLAPFLDVTLRDWRDLRGTRPAQSAVIGWLDAVGLQGTLRTRLPYPCFWWD